MKAIVTVVGKDQVGIIAGVCNTLAASRINVLDISQTIMEGYFTMMMVVDLTECQAPFDALRADLKAVGVEPDRPHRARSVGERGRVSNARGTGNIAGA